MRFAEQIVLLFLLLSPTLSAPSAQCELCTSALSELQVAYQDTETQDLISLLVDGVCEVVPIFDCVNFLEVYLNSVSRIVLQLNTTEQCARLGACENPAASSTELGGVDKCKVCAKVADLVINTLKNPTLESGVETVLNTLCDVLRRGPGCRETVHEYLTMIVEVLTMEDLNGHTLCDWVFFNILGVDCNFSDYLI